MKIVWVILAVVILVIASSFVFINSNRNQPLLPSPTLPPASSKPTVAAPLPTETAYYFPMTNYATRITNRGYGKAITAADNDSFPCGADFSGLHTGDDLEVTTNELNVDVPVYAIADGNVRQAQTVGGYGGLVVVEHSLNNQIVTAYYGHVNLSKTTVKAGDSVKAGQKLTVLGNACSTQTSNERKHLHFAIHKGPTIDVKGYTSSQTDLATWLNPKEILTTLGAQNPATE